jgi:nicotinate-nucleotide adenylyltransferase
MQRIGLYGGSFNPVHLGHVLVAQAAIEELDLHRLVFLPASMSPFKPDSSLAPAAERLRLLRLALAGCSRCAVDEQELQRGGVSYTIDTVRFYRRAFPQAELFYLIGADHVRQLLLWRNSEELARTIEFVAIARPGEPPQEAPVPFRVRRLVGFPFGVSSSQIRERIAAGRSIQKLVPDAVAEAIRNNGLYL